MTRGRVDRSGEDDLSAVAADVDALGDGLSELPTLKSGARK